VEADPATKRGRLRWLGKRAKSAPSDSTGVVAAVPGERATQIQVRVAPGVELGGAAQRLTGAHVATWPEDFLA